MGVCFEEQVDDIAGACDIVWQGGATGPTQQSGPIPIRDRQAVIAVVSVEYCEL